MIPHDLIISQLERELQSSGFVTQSCEEYSVDGKSGEVDLYGFHFQDKILIVAEVKTHDSPKSYHKAKHQLDKDEEYLRRLFFDFEPFKLVRIYCFNGKNKVERRRI